jgi:hypothetical protein
MILTQYETQYAGFIPDVTKRDLSIWQLGKNNFEWIGACNRFSFASADNPKVFTIPLWRNVPLF